jgi:tRNA-Thr(GGU) m(6)t(6)A37 methyltransferase TsaA
MSATDITLQAIATVYNTRKDLSDDDWGDVVSVIELAPGVDPDSLTGLEDFSHVEVLFFFDRVVAGEVEYRSRHPRGNTAWPKVGIFAQRGKNRPNRLGSCIARVVERKGRELHVLGLDAVDGTPVVDLKPVMQEFLPRETVRQPQWSVELMRDYWKRDA